MKSITKEIKKNQQISGLKAIFSNSNLETSNIKSKIIELRNICDKFKKIIKEKIYLLENSQKEIVNLSKEEIKNQIIINIKEIISKYKNDNIKINQKKEILTKELKSKNKVLKLLINKLKYNELKEEKDLLIQLIQEKRGIYKSIESYIDYENNIYNIFEPKNLNFFDNLYEIKIKNFQNDKKFKKIINKNKRHTKENQKLLIERAEDVIYELKDNKKSIKKSINKFINENGFIFKYENIKKKEKYNIKIDLMENINDSSESDSEEEESDALNIKEINKMTKILHKKINNFKTPGISPSSSNKDTNDQEHEIIANNPNLIKILVELKEKYNKLISEKYDLDTQKIKKQKRNKEIKIKIKEIKKISVFSERKLKTYLSKNNNSYSNSNSIMKY
jgi:hypothetical protein